MSSVLRNGVITVDGRMPWSSNQTFLITAEYEQEKTQAIYKPLAGERPLSDFESGLYKREVAAYELSNALGWELVPITIERSDLPFGIGSLQQFVQADFEQHYFTLLEMPELHDQLIKLAVFDLIANNADRKSGHVLLANNNHIWAIDNGLCFHEELKLRTVIWDFAKNPIPRELLNDIARVHANPPPSLTQLLNTQELQALHQRMSQTLTNPLLPEAISPYQLPWPLI